MKKQLHCLLVDDEPEYLEWLAEFIRSKGVNVELATTLLEAQEKVSLKKYDITLLDMEIPIGVKGTQLEDPLINKYPGLSLAIELRNKGYISSSVIAYTVHDDEALEARLDKYGCYYHLKGRPNIIKKALNKIISDRTA